MVPTYPATLHGFDIVPKLTFPVRPVTPETAQFLGVQLFTIVAAPDVVQV